MYFHMPLYFHFCLNPWFVRELIIFHLYFITSFSFLHKMNNYVNYTELSKVLNVIIISYVKYHTRNMSVEEKLQRDSECVYTHLTKAQT